MENGKTVPQMTENALVGCNITINGDKMPHSGKIVYVEGELFEVEFPQGKLFDPGDAVKVVIYSTDGIVYFDTTVIARGTDAIMLIFPPDILDRISKRRQYPRFDVQLAGFVQSITEPVHKEIFQLDTPLEVYIRNISLGGIGFVAAPVSIADHSLLIFDMQLEELEESFLCELEVLHRRKNTDTEEIIYGAQFKELTFKQNCTLRAWLLRKQIELRFLAKDSEGEVKLDI